MDGIFKHQDDFKKKADWVGVKRIAIDEVSHRKGSGKFATVVGDVEAGRWLEVVDSHSSAG